MAFDPHAGSPNPSPEAEGPVYICHPRRSGVRLCVALVFALMAGQTLFACPVCFGAADGPMLSSARLGVLVMAAITCAMLAALGLFFIRIARYGHTSERSEEHQS